MILLQINTKLLDKFSSIITLVIACVMVLCTVRFLFSKNIAHAIFSIFICSLLFYAVNDLNSFMTFINNFISFIGGVLIE